MRSLIGIVILVLFFGGCYWFMNGGSLANRPDCIKYQGNIMCECDYASKELYQEFKRMTPDWEPVIFEDDNYEPCKKASSTSNAEDEPKIDTQNTTSDEDNTPYVNPPPTYPIKSLPKDQGCSHEP